VIVTGASSGFFDRAANLVGSIHHWAPKIKIIFYDLGLSPVQVWVGVLVGATGWWVGCVGGWLGGCMGVYVGGLDVRVCLHLRVCVRLLVSASECVCVCVFACVRACV